ncbi:MULTISPECIES: hypothetical protein [unclassified Akkermansia]|uniref:hypothetical protein n=1 Tax=unclassified Akkermansia TaxID=2608915 RepID=UPI000796BE37|nr:hypothetical protein [Akkermansia sp. KLE1605]KXT54588.1 hypothetical protein HMPREF3038_00266 [Akkermansia sp. KLE1797]KXU54983.1 hypothetical protein HMPREF3039_00864 [Akkermansia sp. KLE1798]
MAAHRPPAAPVRTSSGAHRRGVFLFSLAEGFSMLPKAVSVNGNNPSVKIR